MFCHLSICILIHIRTKGKVGTVKHMFEPSSNFLTDRSKAVLLWIFFLFFFLSLSYCFVCSLQHCDYLLGKG